MEPLEVYACYNTDKGVRLSSSSGAVFSSLAEYVLEQQGCIWRCYVDRLLLCGVYFCYK